MDKRYQVFVSSTYEDLKEERNRIIQALLNFNCIPCGMEYFPAANEDAWDCIERLIPECDYYVILLAGKYGSIPKGRTKSYTHLEYELAVKHKVPVIGLLHRDTSKLPLDKCESATTRRKQLEAFRSQVGRKLCRFWNSADQLSGELIASLSSEMRRTPRVGWVRGDNIADGEAKNEIIKLQRKIELQSKVIEEFQKQEEGLEKNLASGDDPFCLSGNAYGSIVDATAEKETFVDLKFELHFTWNSILRFLREELAGKWSGRDLAEAIFKYIKDQASDLKFEEIQATIPVGRVELDQNRPVDLIQVQLTALGLATRRGNSWELTSKGLTQASRLLAIKKGSDTRDQNTWCSLQWDKPKVRITDWDFW